MTDGLCIISEIVYIITNENLGISYEDIMKLGKTIGSRIKEFRRKRGFTQEELAEKANIHPTFIARIERGNRNCSIETLQIIASALNVPVTELLKPEDKSAVTYSDKLIEKIVDMVKDKTDNEKQYVIDMVELTFKKHKKLTGKK